MGQSKDKVCLFIDPNNGLARCFIGERNPEACQSIGQDYATECAQYGIIIERTFRIRCVHCDNLRMNDEQEEFRWIKPSFLIPKSLLSRMGRVICPDCQPTPKKEVGK